MGPPPPPPRGGGRPERDRDYFYFVTDCFSIKTTPRLNYVFVWVVLLRAAVVLSSTLVEPTERCLSLRP